MNAGVGAFAGSWSGCVLPDSKEERQVTSYAAANTTTTTFMVWYGMIVTAKLLYKLNLEQAKLQLQVKAYQWLALRQMPATQSKNSANAPCLRQSLAS